MTHALASGIIKRKDGTLLLLVYLPDGNVAKFVAVRHRELRQMVKEAGLVVNHPDLDP